MTAVVESVVSLALIPLKSSLQKLLSHRTFSVFVLEDLEVSKLQSPSHRAVMFILVANWIFFFFFDVTFAFDSEIGRM